MVLQGVATNRFGIETRVSEGEGRRVGKSAAGQSSSEGWGGGSRSDVEFRQKLRQPRLIVFDASSGANVFFSKAK